MESRQLICNVSWGSAPTRLPGLGHIAFAAQWFGRTVTDAAVKTDGHAAYNARTLAARNHDAKVQSAAEKKTDDHVQLCHWAAAGLKRWLLGPITAASATSICSPTSTSMPFAIIAEKPRASAASSHAVLKTCSQDNRSPCANSFKTPTNAEHS